MKTIKLLCVAGAAVLALSGCGGGGGDPGTTFGDGSGSGSGNGGTGGSGSLPGTQTPSVASSLAFTSATPDATPLIIQGATASGRTDTGVLKFKLTDQVGSAIANQVVNFSVVPANAVTLNILSGTTNSAGEVTTSITSKTTPTTVVVTAVLASNTALRATSDSLSISGGDPEPAGFQINAAKYNLNGRIIGDATTITARVRDAFGNPVADNYAVSFTTDYGVVDGSCLTVNGVCTVEFRVQNPRGSGIATVRATGTGTSISDEIAINMAGTGSASYRLFDPDTESEATTVTVTSCKEDVPLLVDDGNGRSPAAGTTVAIGYVSNGGSASVKYGATINDVLSADFDPALIVLNFDLTGITSDACSASGNSTRSVQAAIELKAGGITFLRPVTIVYPH